MVEDDRPKQTTFAHVKTLYVYILECADRSFYVGVTNNLHRRLNEHNEGINEGAYTHSRRPVTLQWSQAFANPNEAIAWEKRIKGWGRAKKLALIQGKLDALPGLSRNKRNREG